MNDKKGFILMIVLCGIIGLYFGFCCVQIQKHEVSKVQNIIDRCEAAVMRAYKIEREMIELHFRIQAEKINEILEQNKKLSLELSEIRRKNFSVNQSGRDNSAPDGGEL